MTTTTTYRGQISNGGLQEHAKQMAKAAGLTGNRLQWASASGLSEARSDALDSVRSDRSRENRAIVLARYEEAVLARIKDEAGWTEADAAGYGTPNQRRGARGAELDGLALGEMLQAEGYTDDEIEDAGGIL